MLEVPGTHLAGVAPALGEQFAALVPAPVRQQFLGEVESWLECKEGAKRPGQGDGVAELGNGRLTGEPGGIPVGERELDPVVGAAPFVGEAGASPTQQAHRHVP